MMLSLGKLLLLATAVAVYLSSWRLGACCCCDCRSLAVLAMLSFGKLVQFTAAVAVYLLSWRLLGVRFCCCCRLFAVLVLFYDINSVLSAAAASIYCWLSW
ncbi:hypothetical protein MAM1_0055c03569 [Mucor ambiguus]|uniref:Uncharacterized protein n=1 Tax=Mucor ambiguus TaxID=91626 RepID=A0A0C9LTW5_9FUNG|nr:hypothetical protein MAM1_0055c03569 [Mucor ambiguus]